MLCKIFSFLRNFADFDKLNVKTFEMNAQFKCYFYLQADKNTKINNNEI